MDIFGSSTPGSYHNFSIDTFGSSGANCAYFPIIVTDLSVQLSENYAVSQCFDANYLYSFGHDLARSSMSVSGWVSVNNSCSSDDKNLSAAAEHYEDNRLSAQGNVTDYITLDDYVIPGYLTGFKINTKNVALNLQNVSYLFIPDPFRVTPRWRP